MKKILFTLLVVGVLINLGLPSFVRAAALGEDFTLIVIPDTQNEAQTHPDVMNRQFQWIADQYTAGKNATIAKNIVFVTSVGDIVNTPTSATEFQNADTAYDRLDAAGVPYSVSPGNHDLDGLFNTYFGPGRFAGKSYYKGPMKTGENQNNYSLFSAGGMDFIIINLTFKPSSSVYDWADGLLKANPSRRGIVVQHDMLNTDNSWLNQAAFTALKDNSNLFLMLSGHMHTQTDGSAYRAESGTDGHRIHVLMTDYQEFANGGNGYLRLLRFVPGQDKIAASIYSPTINSYLTSVSNYEQFEMAYVMPDAPTPPPVPIRGDFNADRLVNILDYQRLIGALHTTNAAYSLNGSDNYIDIYDYNEFLKLLK